jgi:hypothetical protein
MARGDRTTGRAALTIHTHTLLNVALYDSVSRGNAVLRKYLMAGDQAPTTPKNPPRADLKCAELVMQEPDGLTRHTQPIPEEQANQWLKDEAAGKFGKEGLTPGTTFSKKPAPCGPGV